MMLTLPINYVIDFDSTIVRCESLDELARIALKNKVNGEAAMAAFEELTISAMNGTIAYNVALERRLALLDATREQVHKLTDFLHTQVTASLKDNMTWLHANSDAVYVVSGGFEDYIVPIMERLGIRAHHVFANRFMYDESGTIMGYDRSSLLSRQGGKGRQINALKLDGTVVMIGDGYTDYEARLQGAAHEFWAFTENVYRDRVVEKADRILTSFASI